MRFENLLKRLAEDYRIQEDRVGEDADIFKVIDMSLCPVDKRENVPGILYFLDTDSYTPGITEVPEIGQNLLWTGSRKPAFCDRFVNWAQIEAADNKKLLSHIQDLLLDSYQTQTLYVSLLQTLLNGQNISTVLSNIAEKANSTLVVIDMSGKVLASSVPFRLQNALWQESVERGYCPPDFIEHVRDVRRSNNLHDLKQNPFLHLCEEAELYYLFSRIIVDGALFGYVFMIQESEYFAPQYREFLPLISRIIADTTLKNQDHLTIRSHLQQNILTDILDGVSKEQAMSRIHTGGIQFPERMCVLVVRPLYFHGKSYLRSTLLPLLARIFPTSLTVLYQKNVVLVIPQKEPLHLPEEALEHLREICEEERLAAGISNPFSNPVKLREYYVQAAKVCALSRRMDIKGAVHEYKDIAFYDMIDNLPKEQRLNRYCHPALAMLREHDQKSGTKLYETLKVYTLSGFNQNLAAEQLFLHRNTMNYRRQKMEELTGLNLENPDTRFLLQYSFLIDSYLEHVIS